MPNDTSPLRVLQVIEASLGGARRYLQNLREALGDGSHIGLAYSLRRADGAFRAFIDEVREAGWSLYEIDMQRAVGFHDIVSTAALRRVYRQFRPDIVHGHCSKAGAVSRLATIGMSPRPGLVYTPNSIAVNMSRIYQPIEALLAKRLDVLAAVTPSEYDELKGLHLLPDSRIRIVNPTIDAVAFAPSDRDAARAALRLGPDPLVIAVARMTAQKDPLFFVDCVAELKRRIPNIRAIWVGDGELRGATEERIAALDLAGHITITGWLDHVQQYYAAADLFISTAAYESFGYVTAEAFAMERAVVASAVTGTIDIVATDREEQLYPPNDVVQAAARAEALLRDPLHAADVARRGRASVLERYSVAEMRRSLDDAYAFAVERAR